VDEILLPALGVGVAVFVLMMAAFFISRTFGRNKQRAFQTYAQQNFPGLPQELEIFVAKQKSKAMALDIALFFDDTRKEIFIITSNKGEQMQHRVFPFSQLAEVVVSDQIIGRGALPKTYSYERTMNLKFEDSSFFRFIAENISNKQGNDQGAQVVKDIFLPWETRLDEILMQKN